MNLRLRSRLDLARLSAPRLRGRLIGLGSALAVFLGLLSTGTARADLAAGPRTDRVEVLQQVKTLLHEHEADRSAMQDVVSILEAHRSEFAGDIRVPLWLAEAHYRMVDPEADIQKVFSQYEEVERFAQQALAMDPDRPEAHYWYGLFLLRKAQHDSWFSAIGSVRKGIRELELVRKNMPAYDHGGAARVLGLLCYTAPGWSPFGDIGRAVELEEEAAQLAPDYLLNRLYLARAYKKKGQTEAAIREYRAIATSEPSAESEARVDQSYRAEARKVLLAMNQPVDRPGGSQVE